MEKKPIRLPVQSSNTSLPRITSLSLSLLDSLIIMRSPFLNLLLSLLVLIGVTTTLTSTAFTPVSSRVVRSWSTFRSAEQQDTPPPNAGVVELGDDDDDDDNNQDESSNVAAAATTTQGDLPQAVRGPLFISQGEVDPDTLTPDFSDAKQTRVVIYTILSLLPVLFLIPFMLGRDFIPLDQLPPVELN